MHTTVPSTRYKPQKIIVKMTHFPEILSDYNEAAALHHDWLARQPFNEPMHVSSFTL
jgi:hypothetical protein